MACDGDGVSIIIGKKIGENSPWVGFMCVFGEVVSVGGGFGVRFCKTMLCMSRYS